MPGPRLKKQEILFIGIPTLCILGGAAFLARQQALRELDSKGPYRTEITSVEVLPVSPFEAWQGFDTKIRVHAEDKGHVDVPAGVQLGSNRRIEQKVTLVGKINGQIQSLPVTSQDFGQGFEPEHPGPLRALMLPRSKELEDTITFLANTSSFDADAPIQLRGDLWVRRMGDSKTQIVPLPPRWTSKSGFQGWHLETLAKAATLSQPLSYATNAGTDRTPPPVEKVEPDMFSPIYAHTNVVGDNGSGFVHVYFKPGTFSRSYPLLRSTAAQVFDADGREVTLKDSDGFISRRTVGWDMNSIPVSAVVRLPLENVPLERGPLKMRVWFAIEDGWPVKIETEVRPAWMSQKPPTLQLQNVQVQGSRVIVTVHYTGNSPLRYESNINNNGRAQHLFFDGRDDTKIYFLPNVSYKRLFTDWSQHYTLPGGKSYWFPNALSVESVSCDATHHCRVVYKTNALSALKPGQSARFAAHVGIQGDGFLPVHATITRPKK